VRVFIDWLVKVFATTNIAKTRYYAFTARLKREML
jgi:hypothetical protein